MTRVLLKWFRESAFGLKKGRFQRMRVGRWGGVLGFGLTWLLGVSCWGQSRVLVEYDGEMLPVFSMQGATPEVLVNNRAVRVTEGRLKVEEAPAYTDGSINVVSRNALMGQDYGSAIGGFFFRFEAVVEAERDFEDCFMLIAISPEQGDPTYILREIPDIEHTGTERIAITVPVYPGFGGGSFAYRLFSRGEEIRRREADGPIAVAQVGEKGPSLASSFRRTQSSPEAGSSEPATVVKERLLDFPQELLGKVSGGYATALFSIGESGEVVELLDLKLDHPAFAPEVLRTVLGSTYRPGRFNGKPLVTTVRQSFFFNEFAPFAEAMEMLPYPEIPDRDAVAVYSPLPNITATGEASFELELVVSELGLVEQARMSEGGDSVLAQAVLEAARGWVFLPAIVDGYPIEQTVNIPVRLGE